MTSAALYLIGSPLEPPSPSFFPSHCCGEQVIYSQNCNFLAAISGYSEDCIFKTVVVALAGWLNVLRCDRDRVAATLRGQSQLLISTQSDHCGQACGPAERFSGQDCNRIKHGQHVTAHANHAEHCRRCVGQSRGRPGFGSAINLFGKDGKDSVAGYKGNEVVQLRLVRHLARVYRWNVISRERVAHRSLNCTTAT